MDHGKDNDDSTSSWTRDILSCFCNYPELDENREGEIATRTKTTQGMKINEESPLEEIEVTISNVDQATQIKHGRGQARINSPSKKSKITSLKPPKVADVRRKDNHHNAVLDPVCTASLHEKKECPIENISSMLPRPKEWPQGKLMLQPTPGSGTLIRGIRLSSSREYIQWNRNSTILPINNGHEDEGQCFVIDFESDLFLGTALLRVQNASTPHSVDGKTKSYFEGKHRKFQAVIRGKFKNPHVQINSCVTGQVFNRHVPKEKLPSAWLISSSVKFIKLLSPQLQVRFQDCPYFLSPLIPTAQTVIVNPSVGSLTTSIESNFEEPSNPTLSILSSLPNPSQWLNELKNCKSVASRVALRKQAFNKLHSKHSGIDKELCFKADREYMFEFFQHLLDLQECSMSILGTTHSLSYMLHGQPIKCLAACHSPKEESDILDSLSYLWSFDFWHSSLYRDSLKHS